jgi:hypothetical protein
MRPIVVFLVAVIWRLHFHAMPLPQSIRHPFDIRLLVDYRLTERFAKLTTLMKDPRIIQVLFIQSNVRRDLLAIPLLAAARRVGACEVAHDVGVELLYGLGGVFDFVEVDAQRLNAPHSVSSTRYAASLSSI